MTVAELLARMSSLELSEWMKLREIEQAERAAEERKGKGTRL
jgi:hypothetical protein